MLSLTLGLVAGPLAALINQQAVYASDTWVCGHGYKGTLHVIPALCLAVVAGMTFESYRSWRSVGAGASDEDDSIATRTRFLAILGMTISVFAALVILAQWLGIFMFEACARL